MSTVGAAATTAGTMQAVIPSVRSDAAASAGSVKIKAEDENTREIFRSVKNLAAHVASTK